MRAVKWLLGSALALVVIIGIALFVITSSIDPNDYKGEMAEAIKKETDLDLQIANINWSLFPWLGFDVSGITLTHPVEGELAKVGQVELSVKFLPLLRSQVEVARVELIETSISVISHFPDVAA